MSQVKGTFWPEEERQKPELSQVRFSLQEPVWDKLEGFLRPLKVELEVELVKSFSCFQPEESKEQRLQPDPLEWSQLNHSPNKNSTSHNPELQDPAFSATYITASGELTRVQTCLMNDT